MKTKQSAETTGNGHMPPPVVRTTEGLRDALFDEIDKLRSGIGNATEAFAIAQLSRQIVAVARIEIDFAALEGRFPNIDRSKTYRLGAPK